MEILDYSIFPERPVVYASFGSRFLAAILDALILLAPRWIIQSIIGGGHSIFGFPFLHFGRATVAGLLVDWLYYALLESGPNMATLGKRALGIHVTDVAGNRISFGQATGRYFGKILSGLILLIGYFMMLWDEKSQTLHDKIAGTLVAKS